MHSLTFSNMSKAYGGVPALADVTLHLAGGRVHALMGENGAGKSTLIKLIAGVVRADSLTVIKDGQTLPLTNAQDAQDAGFRFIHQELNIVPQVSVAENILLGRALPRRFGVAVDWADLRAQARAALKFLGATHIDVRALAGDLPAGDKMMMKIAAALVAAQGTPADLYVFDEPTAALTGEESDMLFAVIERLRAGGAAVLYVSHRMDEVLRICDDVTVLRDGARVSTKPVADTSKAEIIQAMTGRDVKDAYPPRSSAMGDTIARVENVQTRDLHDLTFDIKAGEVLGVSGLAEAGQSRLLRLFMGLNRVQSGRAEFDGAPLPNSPAQAWARGVAYIPRERRADSLCLNMAIRSNIVLPHLGRYGLRAQKRRERRDAVDMGQKVRLKSNGPEQPVGQLSGGNQQKVVFARALLGNPKLLLLDEPTRGVDVGAKYDIYLLVRELSAQGCAVILTSTDLPEILGMCDRVLVLQDGRQAHLLDRAALSGSGDLLTRFYSAEQGGQ
ncbi:sugar ABC transporter ATP-binding protein [Oceaniglobus ichthyenteri]|uniref:sugar ABC transporter ATP-binding protein n=1 Tax=Oceaniglobus ichthyenteri TaxID=2136177 RepID=UPI000D384350|nr:sugar ABC transporter ATP-binding protein [Oceaniglobus ichthyenteri]